LFYFTDCFVLPYADEGLFTGTLFEVEVGLTKTGFPFLIRSGFYFFRMIDSFTLPVPVVEVSYFYKRLRVLDSLKCLDFSVFLAFNFGTIDFDLLRSRTFY